MDCYEIVEVSRDAPMSEITKAFRKKAKKCHPDRGGNSEEFIQLSEAYSKICKERQTAASHDKSYNISLFERFFTIINAEFPDTEDLFEPEFSKHDHHWQV